MNPDSTAIILDMCGRIALDCDWNTLWRWMELSGAAPDDGIRRLNVAPSTRRAGDVQWTRWPVVRADGDGRRLDALVWPLLPAWLKGDLPKFSTANCRAEVDQPFSSAVAKKPTFRTAWRRGRRCLVPVSWFYEWDKRERPSQPWRVLPAAEPVLALAGLWERATPADGDPIDSFTIITTGPNRPLADIGHARAPVVLSPESFDAWLRAGADEAEQLIAPPADDLVRTQAVTRRVNNPEYQGQDLANPGGIEADSSG